MKSSIRILLLVFGICVWAPQEGVAQNYNPFAKRQNQTPQGFTGNSSAMVGDGTSMSPVLILAEQIRQLIEEKNDMEIVHMEFDIIRDTHSITRYITDSYDYQVVAFCDDRIEDLDLAIYRASGTSWVEAGKDNDNNSLCIVNIPKVAGEYRFDIKAYKKKSGYEGGHFGLIICHTK